ncbi:uncharacterized protein BDZ99DRAFT_70196 [Mytilinidion resinicola]|uniref:RED-like N-terminal domain-containing protein n=1 Tax=Mytilinidion resinicola TaxID=574789 RepID=A0A6A6YHH1_9PEZI|nr:uncharacterized protein BDZ99DRAFT_70196 [Mytilinidion resinicola]KAF2807973.1 hypothetical protein BDZ99DRAFT_70196 [Mytilinidion resinicola]
MNNQQFRRLVLDTPARAQNGASSPPNRAGATPGAALGSRARSSIPMTPRSVRGSVNNEFARQLAERNSGGKTQKKFRSSAAPKGYKLAAGYRDRTKDRVDDEDDDRAKRIKALDEQLKEGVIDRPTYEHMVGEITGGDISATHLVKGLDHKLLERVMRGEDVLSGAPPAKAEPEPDVDDEFEQLEEKEVAPLVREKAERLPDEMPPPPLPVAGVKRSRDAILAELKAQRKAAAEAAAAEYEKKYPTLDTGFQRVSENMDKTRVEIDKKGREVLIITDEHGKEKRMVRKAKVAENGDESVPSKPMRTLDHGIKVPEKPAAPPEPEEDSDEDIFEGVGADYNPLAGLDEEDDSSSDEEGEAQPSKKAKASSASTEPEGVPEIQPESSASLPSNPSAPSLDTAATPPPPPRPAPRRDYFASSSTAKAPELTSEKPAIDPAILAALNKVQTMDPESALINTEEDMRLKKRAAMLGGADRDLEDIDMGFGSSRFDDAEELEADKRIKLFEWKGAEAGDDEDGDGKKGDKKRKRGPKKRKGDKNSATDVLNVMKIQKESKTKALG